MIQPLAPFPHVQETNLSNTFILFRNASKNIMRTNIILRYCEAELKILETALLPVKLLKKIVE